MTKTLLSRFKYVGVIERAELAEV